MDKEKKNKEFTIDIIILLIIGSLGLVISIVLAILPESWVVAIIVAIFSSTAFILASIEGIHKAIIEKNSK